MCFSILVNTTNAHAAQLSALQFCFESSCVWCVQQVNGCDLYVWCEITETSVLSSHLCLGWACSALLTSDLCISLRWETLLSVTPLKSRRHNENWASVLRSTAWPTLWISTCGADRRVQLRHCWTHSTSSCCSWWDSSPSCSALQDWNKKPQYFSLTSKRDLMDHL